MKKSNYVKEAESIFKKRYYHKNVLSIKDLDASYPKEYDDNAPPTLDKFHNPAIYNAEKNLTRIYFLSTPSYRSWPGLVLINVHGDRVFYRRDQDGVYIGRDGRRIAQIGGRGPLRPVTSNREYVYEDAATGYKHLN